MNPKEINEKYPIRNPAWSFDLITGRWVAEASELQLSNSDPWCRAWPSNCCKRKLMDANEEEIAGWVYWTSVAGNQIECVIFND
jgi:hypothetical protein